MRFRPLLREVRRSGADSTRNIDPDTGTPKKILSRNALSTEVLEAELRWLARNAPAPRAVRNILRILVGERKTKPRPDHYEALILGQCLPEFGSIENVKTVLQEMEREGIPLEAVNLLAVFPVLSVHPDTYLRSTILHRFAKQQFPVPDFYAHLHILALIREGQLEMATVELEKLSQRNRGTQVPNWLWTIYIHAICDLRSDFDAVLQLLYRLSDSGFLFPRPTLLHLLLKASEASDIHVTKFIWHGYIESMHIMPSEDLCMSVLRVAAKEKDLKLAESVAVVLESIAGNKLTDPPSLEDTQLSSKREMNRLTFDSPDPLGIEGSQDQISPHVPTTAKATDIAPDAAIQTESDSNTNSSVTTPSDVDHLDDDAGISTPTMTWTPFGLVSSSDPNEPTSYRDLATASSTPPPRPLPLEALTLLSELGITGFGPDADFHGDGQGVSWLESNHLDQGQGQGQRTGRRRRKPIRGILYPLFREEAGLAGARFDPRLALMQGWEWRKK